MEKRKGFTLIELMVVILIVSILAGVAIPVMRGRIESAKWAEANAIAGTIRTAVRTYYAEHGDTATTALAGDVADVMSDLGFQTGDLTGSYFDEDDFTIGAHTNGIAVITVTAPDDSFTSASYTLGVDGSWSETAGD